MTFLQEGLPLADPLALQHLPLLTLQGVRFGQDVDILLSAGSELLEDLLAGIFLLKGLVLMDIGVVVLAIGVFCSRQGWKDQ